MSEPAPSITFESSLEQLQSIVHDLEEGRVGLETSLARFEEGVRLLRNCYQFLEQAEQRIEILTGTDAQGNLVTAPFDATATFEKAEKNGGGKPGRRKAAPKPTVDVEPEESDSDEQRLF